MGKFTDWLSNLARKFLKGTKYKEAAEKVSNEQIEAELKKRYPVIGGITDVGDYLTDTVDAFTGKGELDLGRENLDLAKRTQEWNEQFSTQQLEEQQRQFEKSNELAQQNLAYQKEYAEKNYNLQQQAYLDQKAENALMREREDTAYQRQIADLKQAGLSPLMASGGASSAGASVGNAPQYDMSGVSSAQGSLIQLAQEYAELRNMAQGNYANRRIQAVNQQIAAREVLAQQALQRRQMGMNFGMQIANYQMALKDFDLKQQETNEKILASKQQRQWNNEHGYRNQNWISLLLPLFNQLSEKFNFNSDTLATAISNIPEKIANIINNGNVRENIPEVTNKLTENCSKEQLEDLIALASINIWYSDNDLHKIANTYAPLLPKNRQMTSDAFYNWLKRDGVKDVLSIAFGLNYIK